MTVTSDVRANIKVLVVEDGEDQRFLLQRYFELEDCDVTSTDSAETAMKAFAESAPDLAVIDLVLPGMNGWDFAAQIEKVWPSCVVVISSVLDVDSYPVAYAQLTKPVTRATVQRVLEGFGPGRAA